MARKKKMTAAQAAAARRDVTPQMEARARSQEVARRARETQRRVQREQSKSPALVIVVGGILMVAIFGLAWVLTIGPGLLVGG